jgi:hypothetical protein
LTLAKLKKLCVKNRENTVDYIDRAQMAYNNVTEAEKSERELLTNSNIARINDRFVHAFSCGIPSGIWTLETRKTKSSFTQRNV